MEDLPKIDMILISHDHYDHLDIPTLKKLVKQHKPLVLTGLGVEQRLGFVRNSEVIALDWWNKHSYGDDLKIRFVPTRHGSGRGLLDRDKTLWGGFVIESPKGDILFIGDSAYGKCFSQIEEKYDSFRLAVLPIGSYEKREFMKSNHMNPEDAVKVHRQLNVVTSVGSHYATFYEHAEQTIDAHEKDLDAALVKYNVVPDRFRILEFGEGIAIP